MGVTAGCGTVRKPKPKLHLRLRSKKSIMSPVNNSFPVNNYSYKCYFLFLVALLLQKQSFCDSMNALFLQTQWQILVFILKCFLLQYVHKINNQLLSTTNAKNISTFYY